MVGSNGVYELVYFMGESRSIAKYRNSVLPMDSTTDGKDIAEVEKLVSPLLRVILLSL